MTVNYCDHCGKLIGRLVDGNLIEHENAKNSDGAIVDAAATMFIYADLMLCKPCYTGYWNARRNFDIDYFSKNRSVK